MALWLHSFATILLVELFLSRGGCMEEEEVSTRNCVGKNNLVLDCVDINITCGNNQVYLNYRPSGGSSSTTSCTHLDINIECFNLQSGTPIESRGWGFLNKLGYREYYYFRDSRQIRNGEYCVVSACTEAQSFAYHPLLNGTVTCTATATEVTGIASATSSKYYPPSTTIFPASSSSPADFSASSSTSEYFTTISPISSSVVSPSPSASTNEYNTISISSSVYEQQSDVSSSLSINKTSVIAVTEYYTLTTSLTYLSEHQTDVLPSKTKDYDTSTADSSLLPSSSSSSSGGLVSGTNQDIIIAIIVTVGVLGITIAIVILIGLWFKVTRRSKKRLQEMIFYDKIEVGALIFLESKSKSLVTLTESLEPIEQSNNLPLLIRSQVNETSPPPYREFEDSFLTAVILQDTLPAQEQIHLTSLSDENGDLTFSEEVFTHADDAASTNSYIDTASPLQQQHQQLHSTALSDIHKETTSFDGSSISEMCDSEILKTASGVESSFGSFAMIERDDGYLATT